ncbi:MAG TPA: PH domain-containing protein [Phycisphaerales bacterium]|nr:PH domain-containing protein [Phycisphaerales bacterium]
MVMEKQRRQAADWVYGGVWRVLTDWFKVPHAGDAPTLPARSGEMLKQFRPADGWLRMVKFLFWLFMWIPDVAILAGWIAVTVVLPILGVILAIPALAVAVLPDVFVYVGIHLKYDTTWYVMTERSLRIRRGIWIVHEMTISFENVQNVSVRQGPVQRYFGIADVVVDTAGAGGGGGGKHGSTMVANQGIIEGVENAQEIRDMILARVRESRSAGLGDEEHHGEHVVAATQKLGFTQEHVMVLREIRDEVRGLAKSA